MAISDENLALAIPPELKTDHPDASLVVQGILIALAANENSDAMTAKGRMRDTFAALQSVYVPIFQAHIAKEDEDWGALNKRVQIAESKPVTVNTGLPEDIGDAYQWRGEASDGTFWLAELPKGANQTTVKVFSSDKNSRLASGEGDTPVKAIENAYFNNGKRAEVIVPEPEPAKAPDAPLVNPPGHPSLDDAEPPTESEGYTAPFYLVGSPLAESEGYPTIDEAREAAEYLATVSKAREGRPSYISMMDASKTLVNRYVGPRAARHDRPQGWIAPWGKSRADEFFARQRAEGEAARLEYVKRLEAQKNP